MLPAWQIAIAGITLNFFIAWMDYQTGVEVTLSLAYLAPIWLVCWFLGAGAGLAVAALTVALRLIVEIIGGPPVPGVWVAAINCLVRMTFYGSVVWGLTYLKHLQRNLERLAHQRAIALAQEIAERQKLEHALMEISEREQRRIGQDLHDSLCQHLTGTALMSQALAERLEGRGSEDAARALKIVNLVEEGISMARGMARGLHPVKMQADGLMQALEEFASATSEIFKVRCRFECQVPVLIHNPTTATHLYRIAQEAASNAIKHGRADEITIFLEETELGVRLVVSDNGKGLPSPLPAHDGMGLRIMADRAKVVGGNLIQRAGATGGTQIDCQVPLAAFMAGGLNG